MDPEPGAIATPSEPKWGDPISSIPPEHQAELRALAERQPGVEMHSCHRFGRSSVGGRPVGKAGPFMAQCRRMYSRDITRLSSYTE
jgi:hypothetical protein